jgi:hypothetical protein
MSHRITRRIFSAMVLGFAFFAAGCNSCPFTVEKCCGKDGKCCHKADTKGACCGKDGSCCKSAKPADSAVPASK